jgi:hypothetical protein
MKRLALKAALFAWCVALAAQQSANPIVYVNSLKEPQAPVVVGGALILTAKGPWRHVAAAFEHERFENVHSFSRNSFGLFVLIFPLPEHDGDIAPLGAIRYRLIIDGSWTYDPWNPDLTTDTRGVKLSRYVFKAGEEPDRRRFGAWSPGLIADGRARFYFEGDPGEYVTVLGDFSGWDPFIYRMKETSPGVYELTLPLPPGEHVYAFYYKGEIIPDPLNSARLYSPDGAVYSSFTLASAR